MVADRRVVVTGKIPGHSRITAQQALRDAGAIVQDAVGKDTDILVTGDAVGMSKINKATALGVEIVPWAEAFNGKTSGSSKAPIAPRAPMPTVRQWAPMLSKDDSLPAGGNWSFEIKFDGQRGIATIKDGSVYIQSRSGKTELTGRYPEVAEELAGFKNCVLDGELVVLDNQLGLLPEDCDPDPVSRFVVFDVLEEDGQATVNRPLSERREILATLLTRGCYVAPSPVFDDGEAVLAFVKQHKLEGLIAKRIDSKYVEGARGATWLKIKVRLEQEFMVLGYTAGEGAREWAFGALVLGYNEDGEVKYAGRVGTGWDDQMLGSLLGEMEPLLSDTCAYVGMPRDLRDVTWLWPGLVVQIAFQKWTDDLRLWHPSFVRVRDDKEWGEITRDA